MTDKSEPLREGSENVAFQLMELAVVQKLLGNTSVLSQQAPAEMVRSRVVGAYVVELQPRLYCTNTTSATNIAVINATNSHFQKYTDVTGRRTVLLAASTI